LNGTPWEDWLASAPAPVVDALGDDYLTLARAWIADAPGDNARLDPQEHQQLSTWMTEYRLELVNQKIDEPSIGDDRLVLAFVGMIGSVAGPAIVAGLGLATLGPAGAFAALGVGLVTIGYATASVLKNARKARRGRMIQEILDQLAEIVRRSAI
jgi:hypothetical protein